MSHNLIDLVRGRPDTVTVAMNQVGAAYWANHNYLVTEGLNGCTGICIVSSWAGILAHIAPYGDPNIVAKLQEVINYYNTMRAYFAEPRSLIIAALYEGAEGQPNAVRTATSILNRLNIPMKVEYYQVLEAGSARLNGQTSVVIDRTSGTPKIYVNNREIAA